MKILHPVLVLCAACVMTVNAQSTLPSGGVEMTQGSDPLHARLELTKDLIALRVCSDDSLQFVLRLNFSNKGKGPVVLAKKLRTGSGYMISRSFENAIKKKYQLTVEVLGGLDPADAAPDESDFVVLKPGESHSFERVSRLNNRTSMGTGDRVLQMVVQNWPYFASNIEWRERWRSKGYLWTDPITSVPMRFLLEKKPTLVECR